MGRLNPNMDAITAAPEETRLTDTEECLLAELGEQGDEQSEASASA